MTKPKANSRKNSKKKSAKTPSASLTKRILLGCWSLAWKSAIALSLVLALYMIYLDSKVSKQFEGNKWQLPAQIYARAMTFYPTQYLAKSEVLWELKRLNYAQVNRITNTGQYVSAGNTLTIQRRAFEFYDGAEKSRVFKLKFGPKKLTAIYDIDGNEINQARLEPVQLARLANATGQDREFVPIANVPSMLRNTLLLVEDRDFYSHYGVSITSIARALFANVRAGRTVQGGSTLTQQLAKNFYLSRERSLTRKINEALMALILDFRYSKEAILEAYINEVYLGQSRTQGIHGFSLASEFYFAKPLNELEYEQIALLVAMVKGPSYYNPRRFKERTKARRDLVLRLMTENQLISSREYRLAIERPITIEPLARSEKRGYPAYMDQVSRQLKAILNSQSTLDAGVRVFTYFDLQKQEAMELALKSGLPYLERLKKTAELEAAMVAVNVESGGISAMVGGRDSQYKGFNRALDTRRNIGSLVKPAIYLSAFESLRYDLATPVDDSPIEIKNDAGHNWSPGNFDNKFRGRIPLYEAFSQSVNIPAVNVGLDIGLESLIATLNGLGIEQQITPYPSLFLGAIELSSVEVAQMYTTLAANGFYQPITSVSAITNSVGDVIYQHDNQASRHFDEQSSYMTKFAMQKVTREGTAKRLKLHFPTIQLAGKTGSTNNLRDSWYAGFDQNTVTVTWLGRDDNKPTKLTGGIGALELYIRYLKKLNPESIADQRPDSIKWAFVSAETGKQSAPSCGKVINLPIRAEQFIDNPNCHGEAKKEKKSWFDLLWN